MQLENEIKDYDDLFLKYANVNHQNSLREYALNQIKKVIFEREMMGYPKDRSIDIIMFIIKNTEDNLYNLDNEKDGHNE